MWPKKSPRDAFISSSMLCLTNTWQMVDHFWLCSQHYNYRTLVRRLLSILNIVKVFVKHSVKLANIFRTMCNVCQAYRTGTNGRVSVVKLKRITVLTALKASKSVNKSPRKSSRKSFRQSPEWFWNLLNCLPAARAAWTTGRRPRPGCPSWRATRTRTGRPGTTS